MRCHFSDPRTLPFLSDPRPKLYKQPNQEDIIEGPRDTNLRDSVHLGDLPPNKLLSQPLSFPQIRHPIFHWKGERFPGQRFLAKKEAIGISRRQRGLWELRSSPRRLMGNVVQVSPRWLRPGEALCEYPPQLSGPDGQGGEGDSTRVARIRPTPRRRFVALLTGGHDSCPSSLFLVGIFRSLSAHPCGAENLGGREPWGGKGGPGAVPGGSVCVPWAALPWWRRTCLGWARMLTYCLRRLFPLGAGAPGASLTPASAPKKERCCWAATSQPDLPALLHVSSQTAWGPSQPLVLPSVSQCLLRACCALK